MGKIVKYIIIIIIFGVVVQIITGLSPFQSDKEQQSDKERQSDKEYTVRSDNPNIVKHGYHQSHSGNRWVLFTYNKKVTELEVFNFSRKQAPSYGGNSTLYFYKNKGGLPWMGNVTEKLSMEQARSQITSKESGVWGYFYRDFNSKTEFQSCQNMVNFYCKGKFKEQRKRMKNAGIEEVDFVSYFTSDKAKLYRNTRKFSF